MKDSTPRGTHYRPKGRPASPTLAARCRARPTLRASRCTSSPSTYLAAAAEKRGDETQDGARVAAARSARRPRTGTGAARVPVEGSAHRGAEVTAVDAAVKGHAGAGRGAGPCAASGAAL